MKRAFPILAFSIFAMQFAATSAPAQLPPEKAEASFKVSEGLELKLWAAEPLCINPTSMDIDHKGRVWYCESINYRQKLHGDKKLRRPEGDCIVILEDTKGEGKADKRTVFYQAPDFIAPLGICVAPYPSPDRKGGVGYKVFVCHSPHIYVFEDKEGKGKADGPPKILLTGFRGHDHDHGVHGISIGPDNKLYFSVGDEGVKDLQSSDGKGRKWTSNSTDCRAGTIWRCDLDGKNLELIAHNFRNNYKPAVDSFGTIFISDNDDDGLDQTRICFVMPGGNYGYHPRGQGQSHWHEEQPGVVPKVLRTFRGSPTGMCFYEGTLLPKKYQGQPLHTDAGPGRLSCYHLKEKGAGYEVEREDMVTSSDSWFRPSDVCVAPDGSVFVCDWYDPGVGGHGIGDFSRGRIYRVAPNGNKPSVPKLDMDSVKGWQLALASPNQAVRHVAMSFEPPEEKKAFERLGDRQTPLHFRARLLWAFLQPMARMKGTDWPFGVALAGTQAAILQTEPILGCMLIRHVMGLDPVRWSRSGILELPLRDLKLGKLSPIVRREILLSFRAWDAEEAQSRFYELAKHYDGKDRFYLAAIGIAVGQPGISKEIDERRAIILKDFEKHFPEWNDKVAGLVWELRPPGLVPLLEKYWASAKGERARLQIIDILAGQSDPACGFALVRALKDEKSSEMRDHALFHLNNNLTSKWKDLRQSAELEKIINAALDDKDQRAIGIALAAATENAKWVKRVYPAAHPKEAIELRLAAVKALAAFKDDKASDVLGAIAEREENPEALRLEALNGLSVQNIPHAREILREVAASAKRKLGERQVAVAGLAGSNDGAAWLLDARADKKLNEDLTPDLARLLRNSPFPEIKKRAQAELPAPPKLDPKNLPSIPALLARRGNQVRGEQIIAKTLKNDAACLKCHTISGTGGNAGPDLSTIGSKASRQNLLESILYPSRAIADQYSQWIVETTDGKVLNGIIVEETKEHLILRDVNVKDHKIPAGKVADKKKSPLSLMPDNLMLYLSEEELLDIVEYLYHLKNPTAAPVSWRRDQITPAFCL